tara:strand:+ start:295 stop:960 length:666 start_codon:yes stop_codon:yes gene_type:complete
MDNIFTLHKYENEDSDHHLNIDDLYEKKREKDEEQLKIFSKMLKRVHARIQTTSRQRGADKICWFVVPEVMLGIPCYDQGMCIGFIMDKLKTNGFRVQYFHPNTLMITWHHWVPNYVIQEIKEKTGRVYDNQGNDLTPTPDVDYETNNKYNIGNKSLAPGETGTNIVFKSGDNTFQKSKKQSLTSKEKDKKYTPIDNYKPKGNIMYDETFLFDMNKIKSRP